MGCGRFLDHLLVAALERAVALAERDDAAGAVTEDLDFDMARARHEAFEEEAGIAEIARAEPCHRSIAVAYRLLPVASLPEVEFPTISVGASLPGADPETMASAVATPLERQFARIAGVNEMTSGSSIGGTHITPDNTWRWDPSELRLVRPAGRVG